MDYINNSLTSLVFEGHSIRVITLNETSWFVLNDIAHIFDMDDEIILLQGIPESWRAQLYDPLVCPDGKMIYLIKYQAIYSCLLASKNMHLAGQFLSWLEQQNITFQAESALLHEKVIFLRNLWNSLYQTYQYCQTLGVLLEDINTHPLIVTVKLDAIEKGIEECLCGLVYVLQLEELDIGLEEEEIRLKGRAFMQRPLN